MATVTVTSPLEVLRGQLPDLIADAGYGEVYGVQLRADDPAHVPTQVVLQKFVRANAGDAAKAREQLLATLKWRKEFRPLEARREIFSGSRFRGLGYVAKIPRKDAAPEGGAEEEIVAFNIYGAVKDMQHTFGDLDGFLRWRVALMELTIEHLRLNDATTPLPDYGTGPDPYQAVQVHDYLGVSFLRPDPNVRAASKRAIALFSAHYPETVSRKFFVNVPAVMAWFFSAMTLLMSRETARKLAMLTYGSSLASYLGTAALPAVYGGEGPDLEATADAIALDDAALAPSPPPAEEVVAEEGKEEAVAVKA
ncbi:Non-classical phosphatidylinositol transfer protein (PITP) [Cladochytrium tenue]|nr:Non-classical phosphatidylinositol transfer protein (PITP) [Cladochytrium tenue]